MANAGVVVAVIAILLFGIGGCLIFAIGAPKIAAFFGGGSSDPERSARSPQSARSKEEGMRDALRSDRQVPRFAAEPKQPLATQGSPAGTPQGPPGRIPTQGQPGPSDATLQSRRSAAGGKGSGKSDAAGPTSGPPAICPSLVLHTKEVVFIIPMADLRKAKSSNEAFDILGTSGRKLLHVSIKSMPDGRSCLQFASVGVQESPRCVVCAPTMYDPSTMQVLSKDHTEFGFAELNRGGSAVLKYEGRPVMVIDPGSPEELRMMASTTDGTALGTGIVAGDNSWRLSVKPGSDAVLISACMLGLLLLGPPSVGEARAAHLLADSETQSSVDDEHLAAG